MNEAYLIYFKRYMQSQTIEDLFEYMKCDIYIACLCGYNEELVNTILTAGDRVSQTKGWNRLIQPDNEDEVYG